MKNVKIKSSDFSNFVSNIIKWFSLFHGFSRIFTHCVLSRFFTEFHGQMYYFLTDFHAVCSFTFFFTEFHGQMYSFSRMFTHCVLSRFFTEFHGQMYSKCFWGPELSWIFLEFPGFSRRVLRSLILKRVQTFTCTYVDILLGASCCVLIVSDHG